MWLTRNRSLILVLTVLGVLAVNACLPKPSSEGGAVNISLYGFSIMKESLEKDIYPAFIAKVRKEHGFEVRFTSSFAGSETVTNQILQGVKAQVAILSIERDAQRLKEKGFVTSDWHQLLQAVWHNVISTPGSAREARTQFESGYGDALITYELDALLMKQSNAKADAEIIIPEATIFSEHPAVVVDRNVSANDRPVVDAFMQYLWTEEVQRAFVRFHFRSSTSEALNQENKELATIKYPFTVDYFHGWDKAYPEVIEGVFRDQVQK